MPEGLRFRRNNGSARPAEDEWFIPYTAPTTPKPLSSQFIGHSPAPVKSTSSNMLSYFSGPTSTGPLGEPRQSFKFPPLPPTPRSTAPSHVTATDGFPIRLRKAPSQGSLLESSSMRSRIPTANSVPTGLTAPKLLFSPLSREARGSSFTPASASSSPHAINLPRQRTVSAPQRRMRQAYDTPPRRWDAPTVCEKLVFAKPSITPHYITPPGSPEDNDGDSDVFSAFASRVVADGKKREVERNEWAKYVKHRTRSRSFGNELPREDAPVIGNARARERDIERRMSASTKRSSSLKRWIPRHSHTRSMGDLLSRPETQRTESDESVRKSFGFVHRGSNATGTYSKGSSGQQSPMFGDVSDPFRSPEVTIKPFRMAKGNPVEYKPGHSYTRSSPDLLQRPARRSAPGPPARTLRVSNPPVRRQGVVIIGAEDEANRLPVMDFSKPLPPLPSDASPQVDVAAFDSLSHEIGMAISPPTRHAPGPSESEAPPPFPTSVQPSPAHARTYLAEQHRRSRTIKAFQSPSARNSTRIRPPDLSTPSPRSKEPLNASTSTAISSTGTFSSPRKPTALDEAIKRSRASSLSTLDKGSSVMSQSTYKLPAGTIRGDAPEVPKILATAPSFTSGTSLVYPITTDAVNRSPAGLIVPPPLGGRNDSNYSTASKTTVYTDASEGWSRSGTSTPAAGRRSFENSPSPDEEMSDKFKVGINLTWWSTRKVD